MIKPARLQSGDTIRVISPARQLSFVDKTNIALAENRLKSMGYKVTFGKNVSAGGVVSAPIDKRLQDLHEAFSDREVKAVITAIGVYNSNELLDYIDYQLIQKNPKILIGYSDITAIQNAIYAKTKLITYSGPHFSSFAEKLGFGYTEKYFRDCVTKEKEIQILASKKWSADRWYKDQNNRNFMSNPGFSVINRGKADGNIVGGSLCTFNLLQGTKYMPSLTNSILFLEDNQIGLQHIGLFIRNLASLAQQPNFNKVKGIVFGRFHPDCDIDIQRLKSIISSNPALSKIPSIAGVDFGHTEPRITFPIGGQAKLRAISDNDASLTITS